MAKYDERGFEVPDQTPIEVPLNFKRPLTLREEIQRAIRGEMSRQAAEMGLETFEEANDFDVMDEGDMPLSKHEIMEEDEFQVRESAMLDRASKEIEDYERASRESGAGSGRDSDGDYGSGHRDNHAGEEDRAGAGGASGNESESGGRTVAGDQGKVQARVKKQK